MDVYKTVTSAFYYCPSSKELKERYMTGCFPCQIVKTLIASFMKAADKVYETSKEAGKKLLLLGATLYVLYGRMEQENRSTRGAVERLSTGIAERGEIDRREAEAAATRLDEMNVRLDRSRADFQRNLEKLQAELAEQRKAFEAQVQKLEADAASRSEAEKIKLREEFARKQQAELQKLVAEHEAKIKAAAGQADASDAARKAAEEEAAAARRELEKGRRELEELRARFQELEAARNAREKAVSPAAGVLP